MKIKYFNAMLLIWFVTLSGMLLSIPFGTIMTVITMIVTAVPVGCLLFIRRKYIDADVHELTIKFPTRIVEPERSIVYTISLTYYAWRYSVNSVILFIAEQCHVSAGWLSTPGNLYSAKNYACNLAIKGKASNVNRFSDMFDQYTNKNTSLEIIRVAKEKS